MVISNNPAVPVANRPSWVVRPALAITAAAALLVALCGGGANLSLFYLARQDLWLLLAGALLLQFCLSRSGHADHLPAMPQRLPLLVGAGLAFAAYAGHYLILSGYDLSRDEQMASFDAAIFVRGELVAPLAGFWRDHADALNTMFMYPAGQNAAWVSAYLPLNAALRALFALAGDAALTGPAMTLLGALALWGCARRIWPDHCEAPTVALLLYLGSGQIVFNGMTAYAMPAHLALNLCWLWLFLRRSMWADMAALLVGFVAVGLHQPIMHPMFAAPILLTVVLDRDWRRAALYLVGYAAIGAFWLWWPVFVWSLVEANPLAPRADGVDFWTRLLLAIEKGDALRFANMAANLLRFAAWQHLLLLPLLLLGLRAVRRDRLAAALAGGVGLTLTVMTVILPYQGHGFGYRYLHGLIGNMILLAVFGWIALGDRLALWRPLLMRSTIAGLLALLPIQAWMAHGFYAPFARASARIEASDVDYVVVGGSDAPFATDLVINPPFLGERPVRLLRERMAPALIGSLCASSARVGLVDAETLGPIAAYFGAPQSTKAAAANRTLVDKLQRAGCPTFLIGHSA